MDQDQIDDNPWVELESGEKSLEIGLKSPVQLISHIDTNQSNGGLKKLLSPTLTKTKQLNSQKIHQTRNISKKISFINGKRKDLIFGICIVNFHHLRGPEIEYSKIDDEDIESKNLNLSELWPFLPFQALPDGAHSFEESFSLFTLNYLGDSKSNNKPTTLFAISCIRQIKSDELIEKDKDVTRSSVQKSIVVILRQPIFGIIQEKLSIVTKSYFQQKNFTDKLIVDILYDNLKQIYNDDLNYTDEIDFTTGLNLQSIIKKFNKNSLVIFKSLLLEKKLAFYSANSTILCKFQLSFISLIPNLINNLLDSSSSSLNNYSKSLKITTSFQSSDRNSVLQFAGLPLQIFGEGGIFNPYSPLQQFDELQQQCRFYLIGSSNAMLLNRKSQMADVLINIDTASVEILNQDLIQPLLLTSFDKKWINQLYQSVIQSQNDNTNTNFLGNDDYIRWQFEDYLLGLLSTVKFDNLFSNQDHIPNEYKEFENQLKNFNKDYIKAWKKTNNYKTFNTNTDDHIFDVFEPKHIYIEQDLKSTLSEKFQLFNSKKLDNENDKKNSYRDKENQKLYVNTNIPNGSTSIPITPTRGIINDNGKKSHSSPGKIWAWVLASVIAENQEVVVDDRAAGADALDDDAVVVVVVVAVAAAGVGTKPVAVVPIAFDAVFVFQSIAVIELIVPVVVGLKLG
ncbi:hypothetical protein WICMUC_005891 [Wickerhamomyces mucosus]|uniref:UDENN domain-containing protein n=1 Tax=Wickerhamomyces mucosus TaxID=1378264 RepID=A0A9P8T2Q2_9ASCO|nr:hypothetical protein WICMUC_005891 [Wickerhamomyces mucosus]